MQQTQINKNYCFTTSCYSIVPPTITSVPNDEVIYTGDTHTILCSATGSPTPMISYYFNVINITSDVKDGILTLTNITDTANTGSYQCFGHNIHNSSTPLWALVVRDPGKQITLLLKNP